MCLGRDGGRSLRFSGCGSFGKTAFHTWQGQLRPHHGAARRQRRGADPEKNHESGQRHGGTKAAEEQGLAIRHGRRGGSPLHPHQGSLTLGTREKSLTAAPRTKEPLSSFSVSWLARPKSQNHCVVVLDNVCQLLRYRSGSHVRTASEFYADCIKRSIRSLRERSPSMS